MGSSLNAEQIDNILETYSETESVEQTAEECGHSHKTVRKYRDEAIEENDTRMPEVPNDAGEDEDDGIGEIDPGQTPFGPENDSRVIEDYSGMTPGDFIEEFFSNFEVGIRNDWIAIQGRRADRRGKLPTQESLMKDLLNMKSGISESSHKEAEYIAMEYWAEAQHFLRATTYEAESEPISGPNPMGQMGGIGQMPQQGGFGQEFVGPGGLQSGGVGQGGQGQLMQMILQQQQQLRDELQRLRQPQPEQGGDKSTLDRMKELKREQEILKEISGSDERLEQIEQQLVSLQQQAMQDDGGAGPMPASGDQSLEERLIDQAARDPDVSLREVMEIIESREETSDPPEVIEKEKELEIEKMRMENEQSRNERIADTAESLVDKLGEAIGRSIVDGGSADAGQREATEGRETTADGGETQAPQPDPQQQAQAQEPAAPTQAATQPPEQAEECPHCGAELNQHMGGVTCPNCQYGIGSCDLCGFPVEIPPLGEAEYALCGGCETIHEKPDDPDAAIECDNCGWEGTGDDLRGEGIECDKCENLRPLQRQPDPDEAQQKVEELLED